MTQATGARTAPARGRALDPATLAAIAMAGLTTILALGLAVDANVAGPAAVPDVLRGVGATALVFAVCGYAPTLALLPPALKPHQPLFVLPVGAATTGLGLTVLCFAGVPFRPALATLVVLSALAGVALWLRGRRAPAVEAPLRTRLLRVAAPAYIAALIAAIALIPVFRAGYATVVGQNGDAVVAVNTADFLRQAPPRSVRPELPADRMPQVWRSKYPIYYALAAATEVSGLPSTQVFASLMAVMLGFVGLGAYLLVTYGLRAPPAAALLAMALVPLDRILVFLAIHPFHNQIWGVFVLLFTLVFGFAFLRAPDRRSAALLAAFVALGVFAYPLMLPFPLVTLGVAAVMIRRHQAGSPVGPPRWIAALRLPRGRRSLLLWVPLAVAAVPLAGLLVVGAAEKGISAIVVILPGSDLRGWDALHEYLPFHRFFGLVDPFGINWLLLGGLFAAALVGLRTAPRDARSGLGATAAGALLFGAYFKARQFGSFFYFKDLSFLGPLVLLLAATGLARLAAFRDRALGAVGAGGAAVLAAFVVAGARAEIAATYEYLTPSLLEVGQWSHKLPAGSSVRVDLPFGGERLWAARQLSDHPLSVRNFPSGDSFPHPPRGRKADYILSKGGPAPADAAGPPVFADRRYRIYRQRPGVPGPDRSSQRAVESFSSVFE